MNDFSADSTTGSLPPYEQLLAAAMPLPPYASHVPHGRGSRGGRGAYRGQGTRGFRGGRGGGRGQHNPTFVRGTPGHLSQHPSSYVHRQRTTPAAGCIDRFQCCPSRFRLYVGRLTEAACARILLPPQELKKRQRINEVVAGCGDSNESQDPVGAAARDDGPSIPATTLSFPAWPDTTLGEIAARVVRVHLHVLIAEHAARKQGRLIGSNGTTGTNEDVAEETLQNVGAAGDSATEVEAKEDVNNGLGASPRLGPCTEAAAGRLPRSISVALGVGCTTSNGTVAVRMLGHIPFVSVDVMGPGADASSSTGEATANPSDDAAMSVEAPTLVLRRDDDACRLTLSAVNVEVGMPMFATVHQLHW